MTTTLIGLQRATYELDFDDFEKMLERRADGALVVAHGAAADGYVFCAALNDTYPEVLPDYVASFFDANANVNVLLIPVCAEGGGISDEFAALPPRGVVHSARLPMNADWRAAFRFAPARHPSIEAVAIAARDGVFGMINTVSVTGETGLIGFGAADLAYAAERVDNAAIRETIAEYFEEQIALPLGEEDPDLELLLPFVEPPKVSESVEITALRNYYADAEISGYFYGDDLRAPGQLAVEPSVESVADKLSRRKKFNLRVKLTDGAGKFELKHGKKRIKNVEITGNLDRNYEYTLKNGLLSVTRIAVRPVYGVSVVIPVYNAESTLRQAVDSVVKSTLDFFVSTQIVLVDDESSDGSAEICREFAEKYEYNVHFVSIPHGGVSAARNAGLRYAMGEHIIFLDADDKFDANLLQTGVDYLKKNKDCNILSFPLKYFDGAGNVRETKTKRFDRKGTIDIANYPQHTQVSACGVMFRRAILENTRFDTSLTYGEDADFCRRLITREGRYDVHPGVFYNYRRDGGESVTGLKENLLEQLVVFGRKCLQDKYSQYLWINEILDLFDVSAEPNDEFLSLLREIDDDVIESAPMYDRPRRALLRRLREDEMPEETAEFDVTRVRRGEIIGKMTYFGFDDPTLPTADTTLFDGKKLSLLGVMLAYERGFSIPIPSEEDTQRIELEVPVKTAYKYCRAGQTLLKFDEQNVEILAATEKNLFEAFDAEDMESDLARDYKSLYPLFADRRILLFSDGADALFGECETLFREFCGKKDGTEKYFAVGTKTFNASELEEIGATVALGSAQYKLMSLFAEKIIVSDMSALSGDLMWLSPAETVLLPGEKPITAAPDVLIAAQEVERSADPFVETVVLGSPALDALQNRAESVLLFMPSYRESLYRGGGFNTEFAESEYAVKIGDLLLEERLLDYTEAHGVKIVFAPHEKTFLQLSDFEYDEGVDVAPPATSRRELIEECGMLLTDYLSGREAAYLGKPVVYYDFAPDGQQFADGAVYGETVRDHELLIDKLIEIMENGFAAETRAERVQGDACGRIYNWLEGK